MDEISLSYWKEWWCKDEKMKTMTYLGTIAYILRKLTQDYAFCVRIIIVKENKEIRTKEFINK